MKRIALLNCVILFAGITAIAQEVTAPGAELELLSGGFSFTEGPAADAEGNVYFTDQPNDRILKWGTDNVLSVYMKPCNRSNGMFFDAKGNLIACADLKNELWSIAPNGEVTVLVKEYDGKLLNAPNDVYVHPSGAIYMTDPMYKRPWWTDRPSDILQGGEFVYRLSPDGKKLERMKTDIVKPNGIIGTPDGKFLYVSDIGDKKILRFDIAEDGSLSNQTVICNQQSDGMTLDEEGNIYTTSSDGVVVYDKAGKKLQQIKVPQGWTANACFGGKDRDVLFITAMKGLYAIKMRIKGAY
ncbi:SMP-30/gluconolactonase/LRE family protein [bacterium]|nr:SMP-30/gluconolactonase/LRE family protein [bacterium]